MKYARCFLSGPLIFQLAITFCYGQDAFFSSTEFSQLAINPALAGFDGGLKANINHRNQWRKFGGAYRTTSASLDNSFGKNEKDTRSYLGSGLEFCSDNSSSLQSNHTTVRMSTAYHLIINGYEKVSVGIYAGYLGFSSEIDKARWGSQYDGLHYNENIASGENFSSTQKNVMDVGCGAVFSSKLDHRQKEPTFQIGIAGYHLNKPQLSYYSSDSGRLPIRISSFAGMRFPLGRSKNEILPSVFFQAQGKFVFFLVGSMFHFQDNTTIFPSAIGRPGDGLSAGLFYRSSGAMVSRACYQKMNLNVGLSYEVGMVHNSSGTGYKSSSEISIRYSIPSK
jgi:type IX secretion system PorP/SprF family membrane protein